MKAGLVTVLVSAALGGGCGYHVAGRADLLPKNLKTIAVPAFANATTRYQLTDRLPAAIAREFLRRTRYRVVPDAGQADAILQGSVTNYLSYPTVFEPVTSRAVAVQMTVILEIKLTQRETGTVLYHRPMEVRQRYEISVDQVAYFDESGAALERLAQDVARAVVSGILENF